MKALQATVLQHFRGPWTDSLGPAVSAQGQPPAMRPGRIIIFSSFRESVQEIITMLNKHAPYINARCELMKGLRASGISLAGKHPWPA